MTITTTDPRLEQLADVVAYASNYDLDQLPVTVADCTAWFESWSQEYLVAEVTAAESGDQAVMETLGSHRSAAAAAVADCLDGRAVDLDELSAQQSALEEVLP